MEKTLRNLFQERIRYFYFSQAQGVKVSSFGKKLGIGASTFREYFTGRTDNARLTQLEQILIEMDLSISEFFYGTTTCAEKKIARHFRRQLRKNLEKRGMTAYDLIRKLNKSTGKNYEPVVLNYLYSDKKKRYPTLRTMEMLLAALEMNIEEFYRSGENV